MHKIPIKLLYLLTPIFVGAIFGIDIFVNLISRSGARFSLSFLTFSFQNLRELVIIALIGCWFLILKRRFSTSDLGLSQELWRLTVLLTGNYIGIFILKVVFSNYIESDIHTVTAVGTIVNIFFTDLLGLMAIFTLVPILIIIRDLVFHKQRRTTRLYYNLFIWLIIIGSAWVYYSGKVIDFSVLWFANENATVFNIILAWSTGITAVLLSFRNDWITYLPRKQKIIYFSIGAIVFTEIILLQEAVYAPYLPDYSLIIANFANTVWLLMVLYGGFAMVTLLVHLPTARAVDRKLKEVNSLYVFARKLNTELNYQKLPQLITQITSEVLNSQSTWLEFFDSQTRKLKLVSHINLTQQQIINNPFDELEGFNQNLIREKSPVLINDLSQNQQLRHISQWKKDIRAFIAAPLFSSRDQLMGIIYTSKSQPYGFDVDDVSLLEGFANQSAIALENANLWQSSLERERLEQELKIAREVQLKLVPQVMPEIPSFEVDSYFLTAYEVGGDYYDFIEFKDGMPGLVIGDVSGKGTSAAFYMAEFKGVIQTLARHLKNPKELICQANRIFYSTIERKSFVTAIVGKFAPQQNAFQFVRAGHTPVLYYSHKDARSHFLQPAGLGIGLENGSIFDSITEMQKTQLQAGDFLVLFTDGLTEARNKAGEEFGDERLQSLATACDNLNASQIKERILKEITEFIGKNPLHDDLTFIVVKFRG